MNRAMTYRPVSRRSVRWSILLCAALLAASGSTYAQRSSQTGRAKSQSGTQSGKGADRRPGEGKESQAAPGADEAVEGVTDLALLTFDGRDTSVAARKRTPALAPPLGDASLRAISPLEKELEVVVPLRGYPESERPVVENRPIYAEARFGLYTTASLAAGYSGAVWPFDYFARLDLSTTSGFIDQAAQKSLAGAIGGGYIIGDNYGIFSGGHMGAEGGFTSQQYHRIDGASLRDRERQAWYLAATSANTFGGLSFDAKGTYRSLKLSDSASALESSLEGQLKISTGLAGLKFGGGADLRLTTLRGGSISYGSIDGSVTFSLPVLTAKAGAVIAAAAESDGNTVARLAPVAEIRFYPFSALTFSAALTGGIAQNTLQNLLATNPYVVADPRIEHEIEKIGYKATLRFEPFRSFAVRATAAQSSYDSYAYFDRPVGGTFAPQYAAATVTKIIGDLFWSITRSDDLSAMATFVEGSLGGSASGAIPYVPKWVADLSFTHRLGSMPLAITATARYIGSRNASQGNAFAPIVVLGMEGAYRLTSDIDLFLDMRNLLDADYQLWEGYRERGFFGAVGARARL